VSRVVAPGHFLLVHSALTRHSFPVLTAFLCIPEAIRRAASATCGLALLDLFDATASSVLDNVVPAEATAEQIVQIFKSMAKYLYQRQDEAGA
jgi:hypothetical protein